MSQLPNGCHNRAPYREGTWMQDGWTQYADPVFGETRAPRMVFVPFRMSTECNYSKDPMGYGQQDPRCAGCKWKEEK